MGDSHLSNIDTECPIRLWEPYVCMVLSFDVQIFEARDLNTYLGHIFLEGYVILQILF